jgi:hypothetical protein
MMRANSAMPTTRSRPSSTGPSGDVVDDAASSVPLASSRRDRPIQLSGKQIARLIAAKIIRVPRQPCASLR